MGLFSRTPPPENPVQEEDFRRLVNEVRELSEWVTKMERRWADLLEEVEERIDRGNKQWRRIRAAQRREEILEEDEGEDEESLDLFGGNGGGSYPEGVPPLPNYLEARARADSEWEEKKRAINRALGGLGSA